MPIGFHKECCFCSDEELQPTRREGADRLWQLVCIKNYICPHCFDVFRRPIRPTWTTVLAWLSVYVLSYYVVADPQALVRHQWPDENAQVARQLVYAPMMALDPRVHEQRLVLQKFERAIQEGVPAESTDQGVRKKRDQLATLPEARTRM